MSVFQHLLRTAPAPRAAVEISADRVTALAMGGRTGTSLVTGHASAPLPPGAVEPSLTGPNIHDRAALVAAVGRTLEKIGRPRRVGLVVPDPVGKVSVLRLSETPAREDELDRLIRFQVRKSAPFSIDEAQLTWSASSRTAEGRTFVVTIAKREVITAYESAVAEAGAYAGLVDIASFNVINAVLAANAPEGDWLLVYAPAGYVSVAILRDAELVFFRSRSSTADGVADAVHQTAMYYEDRLQGRGFTRVLLSGTEADGSADALRQELETRIKAPVAYTCNLNIVAMAERGDVPPSLQETLAPAAGLLVRGRDAA